MRMNEVSMTALVTLKCHAVDAASSTPILRDTSSIDTLKILEEKYGISTTGIRSNKMLINYVALRAKQYDTITKEFIRKNSNAVVINIGCGLDNRFERIDDGKVIFYDLDLPDIISIKRDIFPKSDRHRYISSSVFDPSWFSQIPKGPLLFLAEGVFMYFERATIKVLFSSLGQHFGQFEIFFEVIRASWLKGWRLKVIELKMKREINFKIEAKLGFGIHRSNELESWDSQLKYLKEWSFLDTNHPALSLLGYFRHFDVFRKFLWSVHYQYSKSTASE